MGPPELALILFVILELQGFFQIAAAVVEIDLVYPILIKINEGDPLRIAGALVPRPAFDSGAGQRTVVCAGRIFKPDMRICLLYTSPSPRDATLSRMPSSA